MQDFELEKEINKEISEGKIKKYFSLTMQEYIELDKNKKYSLKKREFVSFNNEGIGKSEIGFDIYLNDKYIDSFVYFQK